MPLMPGIIYRQKILYNVCSHKGKKVIHPMKFQYIFTHFVHPTYTILTRYYLYPIIICLCGHLDVNILL